MLSLAAMVVARGAAAAASCTPGDSQEQARNRRALETAAWVYGIDRDLLVAIASVESGLCAKAVSPKRALGLMQLMPETAREMRVSNPFDPLQNALGAARLLRSLQARQSRVFRVRSLAGLLAAYNAGEGAVERSHGIPDYRESRQYVGRVLYRYVVTASAGARSGDESWRTTGQIRKPTRLPLNHESDVFDQLQRLRQARERARLGLPGARRTSVLGQSGSGRPHQ